ncbi:3-dehydroquinate synthase [Virgibacillus sp. W0430]|uniref:3-dehydroquinate synthase n=1 Tax=Virgibacillus sp. W0430 TaxID=3391580 RepID=UPI003F45ABB0
MNEIVVSSSSHQYPIYIGEDIRFQLKSYLRKDYSAIMIVTDEKVANLYLQDLRNVLAGYKLIEIIFPSGEQTKSIDFFYKLQTKAISNRLDRKSLMIALGGGVIGDLTGFSAATYMRGIDYIQVPTTILAHDSSVGGKVAINHELGKNMIGSFYAPQAVVYDVHTLRSLNAHEIRSGYAELVKEALLADSTFFNTLMEKNLNSLNSQQLVNHLCQGIKIKAEIVEADEKESNIRMFLNLGHTLGHALESELGYGTMTHGEAVAIGLLFALRVSEYKYDIKLPYEKLYQWLERNNYPLNLPNLNKEQLVNRMKSDKKTMNNRIQMVLLKQAAKPIVEEIQEEQLHTYLDIFLKELVNK